ncbi:MAG TPA: choice-of-anchor F family protein [Sulfurovum sp.]|uniref:choice-of-anchor F family protein n=1 Tax=Sulfurovum sp. TaxID=1969726 RepID=UPI002F93AB9D
MRTNFVKMSVAAAMLLASNAYAGKIIGADADAPYVETTPPTQHGFGGWNFDNVDVRMINAETGELSGEEFYEVDGTYTPLTYGDSFASDITVSETNTTIMGTLNGKDWPVGEPAGIKIINGDTGVNNGKPENCIMTTSYLSAEDTGTGESGYLDTTAIAGPVPTICSSGFQTHKRFKVRMLPDTVADVNTSVGGYGKPIDLVFNLDPDSNSSMQRYQVFSKINNYTDVRLMGYKIEVLDHNKQPNAQLKLSLGIGENDEKLDENNNSTDIWGVDDMANFSHGLWGPYEEHKGVVRFEDGFFDKIRAYLPVSLNNTNDITETTHGAIQGGNYDALFGHWLPSKWQPYGIFFDNDGDPTTDAELVAYWGTTPDEANDVNATPAWHKGMADNFALVSTAEIDAWMANDLYSVGFIEDTLNLGLNYIVEVGDNTADQIGATFTIRITPYVSNDQTPPSYIDENGSYIEPDGGTVIPTTPTSTTVYSSGGGGGCTYNPDSKNFDMMFLVMMAMGLLYPFRRRFIK